MEHEIYIQQCLDLATNAFGKTYPNPMVGCVIVHNNTIIGSGFHERSGESHAEVLAIESVKNKELLSESTLYVNLEPCSHYGKTPPCSLAIIQHKIPRVVIGSVDTNAKVSGAGIKALRNAGVEVICNVLEQKSRELNKRFFTYHEKKRPYIILKWAQSKDGFIDIIHNENTKGVWITDNICKKEVHLWRSQEQSILVGTNTAAIDNPKLTTRDITGNNPLRLVIDLHNRLPQNLHVKDKSTPTVIYTLEHLASTPNLEYVSITNEQNLWDEIFADLYQRGIQSLIIEGGAQILNDCISKNLWDEMRIFTGPVVFKEGVAAPKLPELAKQTTEIGNSSLQIIKKITD